LPTDLPGGWSCRHRNMLATPALAKSTSRSRRLGLTSTSVG
jgi:hypothetical protein